MGKRIILHISRIRRLPGIPDIFYLPVFSLLFTISGLLFSQKAISQSAGELDLDAGKAGKILNCIRIKIPQTVVDSIHVSRIEKFTFNPESVNVNGVESADGVIKLHGSSSMIYRRKSFSVKLKEKMPFIKGNDTLYLRHFFAISLNMDRNYVRNEIAIEVLSRFGIKIPEHFYTRLDLNNSTEGIYMVFNPPAEYALKECNSRIVIRRGYNSSIDDFYTRHLSPYSEKLIKNRFTYIYEYLLPNYSGKSLYKKLDHILEIKSYFDWLAFNYLFRNGDYTDEVYFYWEHKKRKFNIVPWDFDDLFHIEPHEGEKKKEAIIGDKILFSSEDKLDRAIANTPDIYAAYQEEFNLFLKQFSAEDLQKVLENVYNRVVPYFLEERLVEQSKYDKSGLTSLEKLNQDLRNIYVEISNRMTDLRNGPLSKASK